MGGNLEGLLGIMLRIMLRIVFWLQDWDKANSSHTPIPYEQRYMVRDEPEGVVLKQNVGMFMLGSGAEVHIQSFGIFNISLWDDVFEQYMPLSDRDIIIVGADMSLSVACLLAVPGQATASGGSPASSVHPEDWLRLHHLKSPSISKARMRHIELGLQCILMAQQEGSFRVR